MRVAPIEILLILVKMSVGDGADTDEIEDDIFDRILLYRESSGKKLL